jgi:hypothetical protein
MWFRDEFRLFSSRHGPVTLVRWPRTARLSKPALSKRHTYELLGELAAQALYGPRAELVRLCECIDQLPRDLSRMPTHTLLEHLLRAVDREHLLVLRDAAPVEPTPWRGGAADEEPEPQPEPKPPRPAPAPAPAPAPPKELTAHWKPERAYCGDKVHLKGQGKNLGGETGATVNITAAGSAVATLNGKGSASFDLPWSVKDVVFEGKTPPAKQELEAELSAAGLTAKTPKPLVVHRVPDIAQTPITFARSSGRFGWTAAFRAGLKGTTIDVKQTLQIIPAWLGKWVSFVEAQDGRAGWAYVKKVGADWRFWDDTEAGADKWKPLPRAIGSYAVQNIFFVKQGGRFVGREDPTKTWPEAFADAPDYEKKKKDWLGNIHSVWDKKFKMRRKGCQSANKACCDWRIRVTVNWSDTPGDKTVYAVWAQDWERSNAKDWYLTENRLGVAAHECGHLLGAYDEYTGGATDPAKAVIEDNSIMGQNLTRGHGRHFDGFRDEMKKLIDKATSRKWTFEIKGG